MWIFNTLTIFLVNLSGIHGNVMSLLDILSRVSGCPDMMFQHGFVYGCFCGLTPPHRSPYTPVDAIDALCKMHDLCYKQAEQMCMFPHLSMYSYTASQAGVACHDAANTCERYICECDRRFAKRMLAKQMADPRLCQTLRDPGCPQDGNKGGVEGSIGGAMQMLMETWGKRK